MARRTIQKEHKHYVNTGRILYGEEGPYHEMELVTEKLELCPRCGKLIDQLFSTYCGNCGEKLENE